MIATESSKESKARQKAQLELLDRLIPELETEIQKLDKEPTSIEERRKRTDEAIAARTQVLTANQQEIAAHEEKRREAWEKAEQLGRRQASTAEIRRRFGFLEEHYNNDLARLQAIIEMDSISLSFGRYAAPYVAPPPTNTT